MTIESTLERIAAALETIAGNGTPLGAITEPTAGPKASKSKKEKPAASVTEVAASAAASTTAEKPLTLDDVRAKLVAVQTKFKTPDAAKDLIAQFTSDGSKVLSKLDASKYGALIAEADKKLA